MSLSSSLITPLAFAYSTLVLMWAFAGGNLENFWQRSVVLAVSLIVLLFLTPGYSLPIVRDLLNKNYWKLKSTKIALLAGLVLAIPFSVLFLLLRFSSAESLSWVSAYVRNIPHPTWYAILLLPLIVAPILELYWRGILSPQWGTFTTAFLEGLIWGFAAQHVVFFLAGFLSSALLQIFVARSHGLQASLVAKAAWTLVLLLTIAVV